MSLPNMTLVFLMSRILRVMVAILTANANNTTIHYDPLRLFIEMRLRIIGPPAQSRICVSLCFATNIFNGFEHLLIPK